MPLDAKTIETLVEIITREVLLAMVEQEENEESPAGATCVVEIANGVKVKTCFDNAGHVVSAGAERLDLHGRCHPGGYLPGGHDRPYPAQTGCHPR